MTDSQQQEPDMTPQPRQITPTPEPVVLDVDKKPKRRLTELLPLMLGLTLILISVVMVILFPYAFPSVEMTQTPASVAQAEMTSTITPTETAVPTTIPTLEFAQAVAATDTMLSVEYFIGLTWTAAAWTPTFTPTPTPTENLPASFEAVYRMRTATQEAINGAALPKSPPSPTRKFTSIATLTFTPTPTFTPTFTPTLTERERAFALAEIGVESNEMWVHYTENIGGAEMALVPRGCFMMGSDAPEADDSEQPVHEQCFDAPFWIDVTEVTNAAYGSSGRWSGANRPRETVSWFEARDYCAARGDGVRLPTEREWEYAARGVDSLIYPWGDEFVAENVVYSENSGGETAEVGIGIRANGASWVGALDMIGNVWEWVSTIYGIDDGDGNFSENGERLYAYEYDATDGREANNDNSTYIRSLRGGSWILAGNLRASDRAGDIPSSEYLNFGFRCARDF